MTEPTPETGKVVNLSDAPRPRPKPKPPDEPPSQPPPPPPPAALAVCFQPTSDKDVTARCLSDMFRVVRRGSTLLWVCAECGQVHDGSVGRWVVL